MPTPDVSSTLEILSAMITPAVLILASGSLILTTSNRLSRVIDRVREVAAELDPGPGESRPADPERRALASDLLKRSVARARLLQRALARLYLALGAFVSTSIAIGIVELAKYEGGWIVLLLGMFGAALLLNASVLLIVESRRAIVSIFSEMEFLEKRGTIDGVLDETEKARVEQEAETA